MKYTFINPLHKTYNVHVYMYLYMYVTLYMYESVGMCDMNKK